MFDVQLALICCSVFCANLEFPRFQGPDYKKILRLSYDVIITYDNRKSNLR